MAINNIEECIAMWGDTLTKEEKSYVVWHTAMTRKFKDYLSANVLHWHGDDAKCFVEEFARNVDDDGDFSTEAGIDDYIKSIKEFPCISDVAVDKLCKRLKAALKKINKQAA